MCFLEQAILLLRKISFVELLPHSINFYNDFLVQCLKENSLFQFGNMHFACVFGLMPLIKE